MKDVITQMMDYPFNPDKWYPRKQKRRSANELKCPICGGSGKRKDENTKKTRDCLGCNGEGIIKTKGVSALR